MSTEDRLRDALRAHTEAVHPAGSYEEMRSRAAATRRARRLRSTVLTGLATAAAIAVVVVAVTVIGGDDGQRVDVGPAQPGTTAPGDTTTTSTTGAAGDLSAFVHVTDQIKPKAAAQDFAVRYLGMTDPIVGHFQQGGPIDGEVAVRATAAGAVTVVGVRQIPGEAVWGVTFAASENIRAASPGPLDTVSSPVHVTGEARAFEGTVQVEVRQDGQLAGQSLGAGFVTGSGDEILRPFEGDVDFAEPSTPAGAIVFYTESAEDGSVWEATVVRVTFD